jgi:hypothetical protein
MANQVASALLRSARSYAGQLTSLIKSYAPVHLQKGVKVHADEPTEGKVIIHIEARGADAHAQEYGSGLHTDGRKGTKAKYPIPKIPTTPPHFLVFQGTNQFDGWLIRTRQVQHPGIEKFKGKGYIAPAVKEFRAKIKQKGGGLRQEIRQAILGEIKKSFVGANKNE